MKRFKNSKSLYTFVKRKCEFIGLNEKQMWSLHTELDLSSQEIIRRYGIEKRK